MHASVYCVHAKLSCDNQLLALAADSRLVSTERSFLSAGIVSSADPSEKQIFAATGSHQRKRHPHLFVCAIGGQTVIFEDLGATDDRYI